MRAKPPGKVTTALVAHNPEFMGLFTAAVSTGLLDGTLKTMIISAGPAAVTLAAGVYYSLKPDESIKFLKLLDKHAKKVGQTILENEDVKHALFNTLEALSATNEAKKREIIQKVFLDGIIDEPSRQKINFEKMLATCQMISIEAIEYLRFIKKTILPMKEERAWQEVNGMNKKNRENDDEWWLNLQMTRIPESNIINIWINQEYSPNSEKIIKMVPGIQKDTEKAKPYFEKENQIRAESVEMMAELVSLGIMRGSGSNIFISLFGRIFIEFIGK